MKGNCSGFFQNQYIYQKKEAGAAIDAWESERDLVLGEATYKKDNEIRILAIEKLSGDWYAHIAKMERSFNERFVYENNPATPEQLRELRDKCESLEKKFTEFRAAFGAEKDAHKKRIPEMEAAYRNWMDAKEAELARLGDELEKLEAPDIAGRKEMEIKSLKIAEEVEVRKQLEIRETRLAEIMFEQKEMEQDQLKMEWFEACEVLKMLEEREGQGGGQQG